MITGEHLKRVLINRKPTTALSILLVFDVISDENSCAKIPITELAETLGVSTFTISSNLKKLKDVGVISYDRYAARAKKGFGNSRVYKINKL